VTSLRVENVSVPATAINASPEIPRNIAIVMDAGPDQTKVLSKEKDLASALVNELSDAGTSFIIASVGTSSKMPATTLDRSVAIGHIREITADNGEKTDVPIYDAIGSALRQISLTPGLRVVIFIGEGNDGASRMRYAELRGLAESSHRDAARGCERRRPLAFHSGMGSAWSLLADTETIVAQVKGRLAPRAVGENPTPLESLRRSKNAGALWEQ
jgi:hypothetical protein